MLRELDRNILLPGGSGANVSVPCETSPFVSVPSPDCVAAPFPFAPSRFAGACTLELRLRDSLLACGGLFQCSGGDEGCTVMKMLYFFLNGGRGGPPDGGRGLRRIDGEHGDGAVETE